MKKYTWYLLAVFVIAVLLVATSLSKPLKTKEIVIGAPLSLTGSAATDGENIKKGLDLAQKDLQKKGIKVKIIYEDDGTDPKRTVGAMQKIISMNKPDAIVGPTWSFLFDSVSSLLIQNKIVSYSPANTSEFTEENQYSFYGAIKNSRKVHPVEEWLKEKNKKRVGVIVDKSGWGESHIAPFTEAVSNAGSELVFIERIPFGAERDTLPTVLAKARSLNIDALLVTGYEEGLTILIKRIQEQNPGLDLLIAEDIPKTLLKNKKISITDRNEIYIVTVKPSEEFAKRFEAEYGEYPGNYTDRAYDGLMLLAEGVQNKSTSESLADYLHTKTNYKGFATTYSFDEKGDIEGGEWVVEKLK